MLYTVCPAETHAPKLIIFHFHAKTSAPNSSWQERRLPLAQGVMHIRANFQLQYCTSPYRLLTFDTSVAELASSANVCQIAAVDA
jgi:hypothetical protein